MNINQYKIPIFTGIVLIAFFFILCILGGFIDDDKNYEKSKNIKIGMTINNVIKIMEKPPKRIHDIENKAQDTTLRLQFKYYDKKTETEIRIIFNDSLKVALIGYDD